MKKYFLYIGRDITGQHMYKTFYDMSINDGRVWTEQRTPIWDKPLWKKQFVGQIFEATVESMEATQFSFNEKSLAISRWKNIADITKWQLIDKASDLHLKQVRENKGINEYAELLKPIREAYKTAHYNQKSLILSEVMRIITGS